MQKTNEELKKIALDLFNKRIFCNYHLTDLDEINLIFIPLIFMNEKAVDVFKSQNPRFIYQYLSEKLPRTINGFPTFASFHCLNEKETDIMLKYYEDIKKGVEEIQTPCKEE